MTHAVKAPATNSRLNRATRVHAQTMGVLVGIGSIDHGVLEIVQGPRPTPGLIVNALGPGYSWSAWKQGGEPAFTLLPNFLLSGIISTLIGILMIVWALRFLHTRRGPLVFLLLGVASFLTGGGVAQSLLFILTWAVGTRIRAPLAMWRRAIPATARPTLGRLWRWTLTALVALFLGALEIAVVGYVPGVSGEAELQHICWWNLAAALGLYFVSLCSAFAHDIETHSTVSRAV